MSHLKLVNDEYNLLIEVVLLSSYSIVQHQLFEHKSCGFLPFVRFCTLVKSTFVVHGTTECLGELLSQGAYSEQS